MKRIENIAIIGMGALGLLFGDLLDRDVGLSVGFIVDEARMARYRGEPISVNGAAKHFRLLPAGAKGAPADLVIFAVKATALAGAMEDAAGYVGPDSVVLSLLNGITSEELLEARFGRDKVGWNTTRKTARGGSNTCRTTGPGKDSMPWRRCSGAPGCPIRWNRTSGTASGANSC